MRDGHERYTPHLIWGDLEWSELRTFIHECHTATNEKDTTNTLDSKDSIQNKYHLTA